MQTADLLLRWEVFGILIGVVLCFAFGVLTMGHFIGARRWFWAAAILSWAKVVTWGANTDMRTSLRIVCTGLLCAVIGVALVETLQWVRQLQDKTKPASAENIQNDTVSPMRITGVSLEPFVMGKPVQVHIGVINDGGAMISAVSKFTSVWVETLPKETEHEAIERIERELWRQLREGNPLAIGEASSAQPVALSLPPKMEVHITDTSLIVATPEIVHRLNQNSGLYFAGILSSGKHSTQYCVRVDKDRNNGLNLCRQLMGVPTEPHGGLIPYPPAPPALVPTVTLRLVHTDMPAAVLVNSSGTVARDMKWGIALWNRDKPDVVDPLPIPISAFDWLKANSESSALSIFGGVQSMVQPGDRLVGSAFVDCPECAKGHTYLISIIYGQGGWFAEVKSDKAGGWATPVNTSAEGREAYFAAIDRVPQQERIPITAQ